MCVNDYDAPRGTASGGQMPPAAPLCHPSPYATDTHTDPYKLIHTGMYAHAYIIIRNNNRVTSVFRFLYSSVSRSTPDNVYL